MAVVWASTDDEQADNFTDEDPGAMRAIGWAVTLLVLVLVVVGMLIKGGCGQ